MVDNCVLETHMLEDLFLVSARPPTLAVLFKLRVNNREYLIAVARLYEGGKASCCNHERLNLIALLVNELTGFVGGRSEALSYEGKQASVAQLLKEDVFLKRLIIYAHRDGYAQLWR